MDEFFTKLAVFRSHIGPLFPIFFPPLPGDFTYIYIYAPETRASLVAFTYAPGIIVMNALQDYTIP